jgi:hypothetical protein
MQIAPWVARGIGRPMAKDFEAILHELLIELD